MNFPSGNKRINSLLNNNQMSPYSSQKINPRGTIVSPAIQRQSGSKESISGGLANNGGLSIPGTSTGSKHAKGSIIYQNLPIKFEGDLVIKSQKEKERDNSKISRVMTPINPRTFERSSTPNPSSSKLGASPNTSIRGLGSLNFKSNPSSNNNLPFNNLNINKLKRLELSAPKTMAKKTKSYYIPKSSRDKLNLSNISSLSSTNRANKSKLNDSTNTNNTFLNVRGEVSNRGQSRKSEFSANTSFTNMKNARSTTPNAKLSRNGNKLLENKFMKSSTNLNVDRSKSGKKYTISASKSPTNQRVATPNLKQNSNNSTFMATLAQNSKSPFDMTIIKQLNDFKNKQCPTPHILKKLNANNKVNTSKFGGQNIKKIVTGNLMNNTNDSVSKSSTPVIKSQISNSNINVQVTNIVNNTPNISPTTTNAFTINNNVRKDSKEIKITGKLERENSIKNGLPVNTNVTVNRNKERDSKGQIDFKEITTSPLLNKKEVNFDEGKDENSFAGYNILKKLSMNSSNTKQNNSFTVVNNNNLQNLLTMTMPANKISVVKKTIKLIHEFSKVGYSGYGVKKVNQDNYFVFKNFVGNANHYFMAVCDGHGVLGHEVSGYLRENLPINLNNQLKSKNKNILTNNINSFIEDVFLDINYKFHTNEIVDTTFSGSTCVSCIYTPEKIITANVGDSRAVIGRKNVNGDWISHNLSRDHKPNDKDESARIKRKGGRIQPFKDDDGEFIGPHRVWLKEDDIPGLAMSRSFGDRVASSVGVIAEPEIFEYKFQEEDKFFIIASDGVWEFIESDECVNIIKEYYLRNDIVGCCEYIYKESSLRWMKEEEVIDDITMIIVFLE